MLISLIKGICKILFRIEVKGLENIPNTQKLLIVANHESLLDGLLLGLFLPIRATFVVHTSVKDHWLYQQILKLTPHLAVDPASPLAMKKVIKLLDDNQPVVIFPEGRITQTGSLMKVYDGPGFVAAKTGATILPVRIDGASRTYFSKTAENRPKELFPKVSLSILPVTQITLLETLTGKARRKFAGNEMRKTMQHMLFESAPINTIFEALIDAVKLFGRKTKVVEDIKQVEESYGEILKKSLALGRLVSKVSAENENVGVLMPNVTNTICLIYGMSAFARIPAMLNYTAGSAGMQSACDVAKIKTIITSKEFISVANLTAEIKRLKKVKIIYLEDLRSKFNLLDKIWLMAYAVWFPKCAMAKVASNSPAVVLFTSGSEGKPKGVVHSHRSILANIAQIKAVIDFSIDDKFMMVLPLFHAFGFTCGAILPLVAGTRLFIYPSPLHYRVIPEVIYERGCTVLFGTSTFLGNYAKFANPYDFYKLRYVVSGAEKLSDDVRAAWVDKFGIRILEGYGATECAPVLAVNTPMANKVGSVGTLLPSLEGRLDAVPGITEGGLLHVKGPNVMLGYYLYDKPGEIQAPIAGWYNTGDIVDIDTEGYVFIKGRVKRFAKVAGEMVSLETVEAIAQHAARDHQHAATTLVDNQRGETILLFTTDENLNREQLSNSAKTLRHIELAVARKIIFIAELPLLGTGKVDYLTLKKMAEKAGAK